eukprot:gene5634-7780_t
MNYPRSSHSIRRSRSRDRENRNNRDDTRRKRSTSRERDQRDNQKYERENERGRIRDREINSRDETRNRDRIRTSKRSRSRDGRDVDREQRDRIRKENKPDFADIKNIVQEIKVNSDINKRDIINGQNKNQTKNTTTSTAIETNTDKNKITSKDENKENDIQYDDSDLKDIEQFLDLDEDGLFVGLNPEEEERREAERLAKERKKRLEEIAKKFELNIPTDENQSSNNDNDSNQRTVSNISLASLAIDEQINGKNGNNINLSPKSIITSSLPPQSIFDITNNHKADIIHHKHVNGFEKASSMIDIGDEGKQLQEERSALEAEEKLHNNKLTFDMFSSSPSDLERKSGKKAFREALLEGEDPHLQSNWDDGEGYYKARIGEVIGDRFQTLGIVGKGVFSTVLKCVDMRLGDGSNHVAIKMIRNNDTMRKASEKEKQILLAICEKDPDGRRHCVRLQTYLEYRNHVALVFEYQPMNLREVLKKFGKDVGINIGAVRMYGKQLFIALRLLQELRVVHADIKLDNILCSSDLKQVKLCDFGSAFFETDTDNNPTPYLVSRFYRAPEIILGMAYDRGIDMFSVCVCLYELFTGHVMFPGRTNNEMMRLMMAVKGRIPNKLVKAHIRSYEAMALEPHFDPDLRFRQYELDPITGKVVLRLIDINNPSKDLSTVLRSSKAGADDMKLVSGLTDLLEKGLNLDPSKRMLVGDALRHPFIMSSTVHVNSSSTNNEKNNSNK